MHRRLASLLFPAFLVVYILFFFGTVDGRLEGDDHIALAHAAALVGGDRLNVDVFDPGMPLQVVMSYVGQRLVGATLAEVLLALAIRLIGLTALYLLTVRISRNRVIGVVVAATVALLLLHEAVYSAEKLALYPIAMLAAWRFLEGRLSPYVLSVVIAVAALIRHDHGVYVAITMAVAVCLRPQPLATLARVGGATLALLAPWLIWIHATEGLPSYVVSRIAFAQDNGLGVERPFGFAAPYEWNDVNAALWLWHVAALTTIAALATGIMTRSAPLTVLAVMSAVAMSGLMRKAGQSAEVAAMWIPLFVWLAREWRWYGRTALAGVAVVTVAAVLTVTHAQDELQQIARDGGGLLRRVPNAVRFHLVTPAIDAYAPVDDTTDERLVVRYLYECLRPADRVWETSMWYPVMYYPQRRPVWHFHWEHGLKHDDASQRAFLEWIAHEQAPVIVTRGRSDPFSVFAMYPLVRPYVETHYRAASSSRFDAFRERYRVGLLIDRRRAPTGTWEPLDLPCFRGQAPGPEPADRS